MSMSNHEISVAADKAADYIDKHGWTQNTIQNSAGNVCVGGACVFTKGWMNMQEPLRDYLGVDDVVTWNDTPGRTQEEVVEVLRNVATKYRSDEMRQNG